MARKKNVRSLGRQSMKRTKGGAGTGALLNMAGNNTWTGAIPLSTADKKLTPMALGTIQPCI